ncbi:hypothetical protein [Arcanobacterium buesumense]|uniref:Uncharacterized protein n=1 Tax=Arcanobacterium buesumense TaxID=2722751 RepID=A0A6H2ELP5_9ACTO|nr:hypothetical protein [Arcanobacterium buesumense]QJC21994.1 hypothetical protein HC352_05420 [Arcanobacterium buesumense]
MTGAKMRLVRMALGYSMAEFISEMQAAWPKADREAVQRWERGIWEIPDVVAEHVEGLWTRMMFKIDAALNELDDLAEESIEPDAVDLTIFATPQSLEKAHPGMGWNQHTAQVGLMAVALESSGYEVRVSYAPIEK